ncbi:hypothetical protein HDU86_001007 [Geranomyces michiganensis]|nr:hypothetical protein HDU86_001007 [Geranomyces michiganensis]
MTKCCNKGASSALAKRRCKGDHMNPAPSANTNEAAATASSANINDAAATATTAAMDAETELWKKLDSALNSAFSALNRPKDADTDEAEEFMHLSGNLFGRRLPYLLAVMKRMFAKLQTQKRVGSVKTETEGDIERPPEEQAGDERAVLQARAEHAEAVSIRAQQKEAEAAERERRELRLARYTDIIASYRNSGTTHHHVPEENVLAHITGEIDGVNELTYQG